jgi:heme/copper-type cytochrome/quinol oxidase subunit 4
MHLPLIVTLVIALPLDQALQAVVMHSAVQYSLDLILFLTIDESWGWGWHMSGELPLFIVLLSIPFPSSFYPHSLHLYW